MDRSLPVSPTQFCSADGRWFRRWASSLAGAMLMASLASPVAASEPSTRLVRCGAENCLRVTGHRDDPAAIVSINGHAVAVEGKRSWEVHLPVEVVREWSAPFARTIEIALHDSEQQRRTSASVDLPIGMLGSVDLASLEVSLN